ncbi:dynamin family protein [Selenomonas massiliensis]|uniref:dynamin family protein n=1 Tax=Selenomonas massiliensis TaxID=2058293 RepID=UPI000D0E500B|nr:dynamin family protein [Selenomonas massiliensis]
MIAKDYQQNKKEVLSLYHAYENFCQKAGVSVDESMKIQAQKIKDEEFVLMVLGEAKSGKSTFINAYLGTEVVPMDVRQCTSAIIKIRHGGDFCLLARMAGGGQTRVRGAEGIRNFLKQHAALSDDYRQIPVSTINSELLLPARGKAIPESEISAFLQAERGNNFYNLNEDTYNNLIRQYIKQEQQNWKKIITEIEIECPLPDAMRGITIIDSPGTGANGSVGRIAEEYLVHANAVIFVKSLSGQALESTSFMNFFHNGCKEKQKESLFLTFTRIADLSKQDFDRLRDQAVNLYSKDIDKEKLLFVDSKIQLVLNHCRMLETAERIGAYYKQMDAEGNDFAPASICWLQSRDDVAQYIAKMEALSSFDDVHASLEKFARKAHYIQLMGFVENIDSAYRRHKGKFSDALQMAKKHLHDPAALEHAIREKKEEIQVIYNKINDGVVEIYNEYTDTLNRNGIVHLTAEKLKNEYARELNNFSDLPEYEINDQTFRQMKTMTFDAIERSKDVRAQIAESFLGACNERLVQLEASDAISADIYLPNFTESDFDLIRTLTQMYSDEYKEIETGYTFKSVERTPYYSRRKHVRLVAKSIRERLEADIVPKMVDNVIDYIEACRKVYTKKLTENKESMEQEYDKLLRDKEDNEKRQRDIARLEQNLHLIAEEQTNTMKLKGVIANYVDVR